jgi:hypothetical protein
MFITVQALGSYARCETHYTNIILQPTSFWAI